MDPNNDMVIALYEKLGESNYQTEQLIYANKYS